MMKTDVCKIHRTCMLIMDNVKRANEYTIQFSFLTTSLEFYLSRGILAISWTKTPKAPTCSVHSLVKS